MARLKSPPAPVKTIPQIILWPDPRLNAKCEPVTVFDDDLRAIAVKLKDAMEKYAGVGLAAPQIGIMQRIFVFRPTNGGVKVLINPEIIHRDGIREGIESCLSLPNVRANVLRSVIIDVTWQDFNGGEQRGRFASSDARVIQHELDHLNGITLHRHMAK